MQHILAKANNKRGELYLYDQIGGDWFGEGLTAQSVADALAELRDAKITGLDVFIDSPGGIVHEGVAIYNQLLRLDVPKTVHVDGLAASIASVIAMAGDEIVMGKGSMMMIHDPSTIAMGTAADMRKTAETLDTVRDVIVDVYLERTGGDRKTISDWMAEETWMKPELCVERGFASKVAAESTVKNAASGAAVIMLSKYRHTPPELLDRSSIAAAKRARAAHMQMRVSRMRQAAGPSARAA